MPEDPYKFDEHSFVTNQFTGKTLNGRKSPELGTAVVFQHIVVKVLGMQVDLERREDSLGIFQDKKATHIAGLVTQCIFHIFRVYTIVCYLRC